MPTFIMTFDFEVYCNTCGKGICYQANVSDDRIDMEPCPYCEENHKNEKIELEKRIEELENDIEEKDSKIYDLEQAIIEQLNK